MSAALHICAPHTILEARVQLPGSKSISNRLLTVAAWAQQPLFIQNVSDSEDTAVFVRWLTSLGHSLHEQTGGLGLQPAQQPIVALSHTIDLGLAGTALRFIAAACTQLPGSFTLSGSTRLGQRPVLPLLRTLQAAGSRIQHNAGEQVFPIHIVGQPASAPMHYTLDAAASSQLLSALLLLAPAIPVGSSIALTAAPSTPPYVHLTLGLLAQWGYVWATTPTGYVLLQQGHLPEQCTVESDWSAASYPLAHLLLRGGSVQLPHLQHNSLQGDAAQLQYWQQLGMHCHFTQTGLQANAKPHNTLPAFDFDFAAMPDLAQTFAVLALWATGPCTLRGLHTLPHKETNRITALATELGKLGALVQHDSHSMTITPPTVAVPTAHIATYDDHRMAMAFSMAALRCPGLVVEAPAVVGKSYPAFWQDLQAMGYTLKGG